MKNEKPMLFSGPMVLSLLEGRKTQTRRIFKYPKLGAHDCQMRDLMDGKPGAPLWPHQLFGDGRYHKLPCPYGKKGGRIWVKETFQSVAAMNICHKMDDYFVYRATDPDWNCMEGWKWKPSIFMTREASRIALEIVYIRVERLQNISENDAKAEGIFLNSQGVYHYDDGAIIGQSNHKNAYQSLWEKINGNESWEANPWVWAITFKRI